MTGLPEALDLADSCFRAWLEPLRDLLPPPTGDGAGIPFVVVVPHLPVVPVLESVHTVGGRGLHDDGRPTTWRGFRPLPELGVPTGPYLLARRRHRRRTPSTAARRGAAAARPRPAGRR